MPLQKKQKLTPPKKIYVLCICLEFQPFYF